MNDLQQILTTAAHHLFLRIDAIEPPHSTSGSNDSLVQVTGLVADVIRSTPREQEPPIEIGSQLTIVIPILTNDSEGDAASIHEMLQLRGVYEVILDRDLAVIDNLIEQVDEQPEDPRYSEFGAFHG